jgi:tRNA dimethylallyltransferase
MTKPKVLTIIGPTASGKTEAAIKAARKIKSISGKDAEIISADSRQVYKHIPIATAQPSKEQLKKFNHHFIATLELDEEFNAGEFGKKGRVLIDKIIRKEKIPIIAGGSGLYISSLIYGFFDYGQFHDEELRVKQKLLRRKLYDKLEKFGLDALLSDLKTSDPVSAANLPQLTERRVIRALEVYHLTGIPISSHKNNKIDIGFEAVQIGINRDREELYGRINKRVDTMVENGLIDEVKKLKRKGYHYTKYNSLNTVGIKEVFDYLNNDISYERMVELIKQNTRRYAKRQMTWFRRDENIRWVNYNDFESVLDAIISKISSLS